jgi:hypothetical protein
MQDNSSDAATFAQFGEYLETEGEGLLEGTCEEPDANLIALAKEDLESDCNLPATSPGTNGISASGQAGSGRQRLHKRARRRQKRARGATQSDHVARSAYQAASQMWGSAPNPRARATRLRYEWYMRGIRFLSANPVTRTRALGTPVARSPDTTCNASTLQAQESAVTCTNGGTVIRV